MKKIYFLLLAVVALFATSCATDGLSDEQVLGGESLVTLSVETAASSSRTIADGAKATTLKYAVYEEDWTYLYEADATLEDLKAELNLELLTGYTYQLAFWADANKGYYTPDFENKKVTVSYDGATANDESRDAFYGILTVEVKGSTKASVKLQRPFAQINFGANDIEAAKKAGFNTDNYTTKLTVSAYETLNFVDGSVENPVTATFAEAAPQSETATLTAGGKSYAWISMNYILWNNANTSLSECTMVATDGTKTATVEYPMAPACRNWRTNLVGSIFTDNTKVDVEITPGTDGDNDLGYIVKGDTYYVTSADGLSAIAALVNGGETLSGKTVELQEDIDLSSTTRAESNWVPIGTYDNQFKGSFDGNGYTIKNLVIDMPNSNNVGLFGYTSGGEIKNLVIENATVNGRNQTGVVAGTPWTTKYSNITVKGHIELTGCGYVGVVGGYSAYADWNDITINVDDSSFVHAHANQNGKMIRAYVGGVCGFRGEGDHLFKNITSNINVKGATVDIGGLVGIAHYGNKFENCVCTGNVENYSSVEDDINETGGLAGVWHNGGADVVFTNCSFTGTVSSQFDVTLPNGGLVGRSYKTSGTGKLIFVNNVTTAADLINKLNADVAAGLTELVYDAQGANVGTFSGNTGFTKDNVPAGVTITIRNANVTGVSRNNSAFGTLIFENCTFSNNSAYSINFIYGNGLVVFNKCTLVGWSSFGSVTVEMNNCTVRGNGKYALVRSYNAFSMNNCDIDCSNTNTTDDFHDGVSIGGGNVLTMTDCTMTNAAYEYGEGADQKTMDYTSYILVNGKRLANNQPSLEAALAAGNEVLMENDITMEAHISCSTYGSINIDGGGNTLTCRGIYANGYGTTLKTSLSNMTLVDNNVGDYTIYNNCADIELTNVTYNSSINKAFTLGGGGNVSLNNCNITGDVTGSYSASNIWCGDGRAVTVNGGTYGSIFINASKGAGVLSAGSITVNDGTIGKLILETEKNAEGTGYKSATLIQNGGTIETLVENPQNYDLTGLEKIN